MKVSLLLWTQRLRVANAPANDVFRGPGWESRPEAPWGPLGGLRRHVSRYYRDLVNGLAQETKKAPRQDLSRRGASVSYQENRSGTALRIAVTAETIIIQDRTPIPSTGGEGS